jgi:peroxiredoxin Q/BCP
MATFQKDLSSFERLNAQVLGVSADTIESHNRFAESLDLKFPLISDPGGKIQATYGPGRVTFVIDKNGVIRHIQKGMPENKKLLKILQSITD